MRKRVNKWIFTAAAGILLCTAGFGLHAKALEEWDGSEGLMAAQTGSEGTAGQPQEDAGGAETVPPLPAQAIGDDWQAARGEAASRGFTYLAMENGRVAFYVNEAGNVGVYDKEARVWYTSIPSEADREADPVAKAINKVNLGSDYWVTFVDQNGGASVKNTLNGAVKDGNVRLTACEDGLKVWYYFEDEDVCFSVRYRLTEDGFTVVIPFEDIVEQIETGRNSKVEDAYYKHEESASLDNMNKAQALYYGLYEISILPYFGAAGPEDEGYLFIPDGSGALINFNNRKAFYGAYSQDIYGRDPVLNLEVSLKTAENVLMPVFGASFGDHGFLASAEKGAASANLNAMTSGSLTSYNNVYMKFRYRQSMTLSRLVDNGYGADRALGSTIVVDNTYSEGCYELRYFLLGEENADYVGMAKRYREHLADQGMTKKVEAGESPLYLTLYGGIEQTEYFMGLPYDAVTELTSYDQAREILRELTEDGVDQIALRYCGWQKDGLESAVPAKAKPESALGGSSGWKKLLSYAKEQGIQLFADVDFVNFYRSGNGYFLSQDAVQNAGSEAALQYTYDLNTGAKNGREDAWRLLNPGKSLKAMQTFLGRVEKLGIDSLSLGSVGSILTSDFSRKAAGIHRDDAATRLAEMVREAGESAGGVMIETGNIYAAMYADHIVNVTGDSTHFDLADETVPFYQIVLHGYVSYGTEPINLTADPDRAVLKALETGSSLGYALIQGDTIELVETRYNFLFNAGYEDWRHSAAESYLETKACLAAVADSCITGHEKLSRDVYRTDYGQAGSVYVNYGSKDATAEGVTIPAGGFVFLENQEREGR